MKIAVTGARGFVGQSLVDFLLQNTDHSIVALSRRSIQSDNPRVEHRQADFFSLKDAERALADCDVGVYLLHSMLPSNRLNQGSFEDFDFLLADNFARAARKNKLRQILYVGGIVPDDESKLSKHLRSRKEVEGVLTASGVPVTVLRSSLIIGRLGSSFLMLKKLVYRLPSFVLPSWANTPCQPIYIQDMLQIVNACLLNQETFGRTFDCGSPDVFTYKQLISMTAEAAGLKRHFFNLPNIPVWFSKLWVCLISGASSKLVNPLVDSLTTPMLVSPRRQLPQSLRPSFTPIMEAISLSLPNHDGKRQTLHSKPNRRVRARNQVRSIQRLPMPHGLDALAIAEEYLAWLPKLFSGFVYVDTKGPDAVFLLKGFEFELLRLSFAPDRSSTDRQLFYITGGALAQEQQEANNKTYVSDATQAKLGRLEFRECPSGLHLFAAIHDYKPSLPWWIYLYTQALVHKFVMHRFGRYLEKLMRFNPREVAEQ